MSKSRRSPAPSARSIAARVLDRVERDGAYAAAALDAELSRLPELDPRDRALATELVYGVLRTRKALLERVGRFVPRGIEKTDRKALTHLLVAAYQILFLDRVPPFAAVDAAVDLVRESRGDKIAGFANAVLRKLAAGERGSDRAEAIVSSAPRWLVERLERDVGVDEARALLGASEAAALGAMTLRLRPGVPEPEFLSGAQHGRVCPRSRIVRGEGDPRRRPELARGDVVIQEEGAQAVALALGVRPGDRVLDACAGRGQKTAMLAEALEGQGELFASDVHAAKLRALESELGRLGLPAPKTVRVDLSIGTDALPSGFDRVLVDAPCTGSGTLRRRPEIVDRLDPEAPARLGALAERILRNAGGLAKPGGRVVFAVCSVFREEAEDVVAAVADLLVPAPFDAPELDGVIEPGATSFRLLPLRHGTDGYFVASLVRR